MTIKFLKEIEITGITGSGLVIANTTGPSDAFALATVQPSGGGALTVPIGLVVSSEVTGGTISHVVAILGYNKPGPSDVQADRYGVEGRVDQAYRPSSPLASIAYGVLGFATFNHATDNSNSVAVGVRGKAELGPAATGGNAIMAIGGWFTAANAAILYSLIAGDGTVVGHNAAFGLRGYISSAGGGETEAKFLIDDVSDTLFLVLTDSRLLGLNIQLGDTAGATAVKVLDSTGAQVAKIDSDGNAIFNKVTVTANPTAALELAPKQYIDAVSWDSITAVVGSDATTTGQALVDTTGLTATMLAASTYEFEATLSVLTTAVVTGQQFGVNLTQTPVSVDCIIQGVTTTTTVVVQGIIANNTANVTAMNTTSAGHGLVTIKGIIRTHATLSSTFSIRHLKVTSGTSTIKVGSTLKIRKTA